MPHTNEQNICLSLDGASGIGDKLQFASLPEAFYKWHGVRLIDCDESWVFDNNPFVRRDVEDYLKVEFEGSITDVPFIYCRERDWINSDLKGNKVIQVGGSMQSLLIVKIYPNGSDDWITSSRNFWLNKLVEIIPSKKPELDIPRGPRLYKYEDPSIVKPNQIAIHVGPSNSTYQYIPSHVLDKIAERYSNYDIVQVGSLKDRNTQFIDKRGLKIWDTVKTIAESAIFIGINSGPMNIANCYPHINKKLILHNNYHWTTDEFVRFEPLCGAIVPNWGWADFGWQYYTTDDYDVGRMYSYKRI
jgi:hypothetical protein